MCSNMGCYTAYLHHTQVQKKQIKQWGYIVGLLQYKRMIWLPRWGCWRRRWSRSERRHSCVVWKLDMTGGKATRKGLKLQTLLHNTFTSAEKTGVDLCGRLKTTVWCCDWSLHLLRTLHTQHSQADRYPGTEKQLHTSCCVQKYRLHFADLKGGKRFETMWSFSTQLSCVNYLKSDKVQCYLSSNCKSLRCSPKWTMQIQQALRVSPEKCFRAVLSCRVYTCVRSMHNFTVNIWCTHFSISSEA